MSLEAAKSHSWISTCASCTNSEEAICAKLASAEMLSGARSRDKRETNPELDLTFEILANIQLAPMLDPSERQHDTISLHLRTP
jgi:hypothetical protein